MSRFPQVYPMGFGWRCFCVVVGLGLTLLGANEIVVGPRFAQPLIVIAACVGNVLLGCGIIVGTFKSKIILYEDAIEVVGLFRRRRLDRQEIGAKISFYAGCPTYSLIPWRKVQRKLRVPVALQPDDLFKTWIDSIPNADPNFLRSRRRGAFETKAG